MRVTYGGNSSMYNSEPGKFRRYQHGTFDMNMTIYKSGKNIG